MQENTPKEPPELKPGQPALVGDSVILVFKGGYQYEVKGGPRDAVRFRRPWPHKAWSEKNGREIWFKGRDLLFTELVTAAEKERKLREAAEKAAAEQKMNPKPGRDPVFTPAPGHRCFNRN